MQVATTRTAHSGPAHSGPAATPVCASGAPARLPAWTRAWGNGPPPGLAGLPLPLQAQLAISAPGDVYEQEADRVAEQVMRMPDPAAPAPGLVPSGRGVAGLRRCACGGSAGPDGECAACRAKRLGLQRRAAPGADPVAAPPVVHQVLQSAGRPLEGAPRAFMEPRFGQDFSAVRIHTDAQAAESAQAIQALAYTVGPHIVFAARHYAPDTNHGRRLLAHELAHVVQQGAAVTGGEPAGAPPGGPGPGLRRMPGLQRRVSYNVLDWDASKLGPPTPRNWAADNRLIEIPPTGQIQISALVEVNGDAGDACADHTIGTTQTAWIAWTIAHYRGQNPGDGSITVRHRAPMPMRDPGLGGAIWYNPSARNVLKPGACGDSLGIFHIDSPHHAVPKARNNGAVTGSPLNYLVSYTRGLHLVAYLTAQDPAGNFLPQPLRFRYWNSLQDFQFTPNYATPLNMWAFTGGIRVNIGSAGRGETADAPYFTTAGTEYNAHFNDAANWDITERP